MNISTRSSQPERTTLSQPKAKASHQNPPAPQQTVKSSQDKPSSPEPAETVSLSADSRSSGIPAGSSSSPQMDGLLQGLSSWATPEAPSLQLEEGQLLAQGRGSESGQVSQLQELLNSRGQQLEVDGQFGPQTAEAVRAVQAELGVTVDGIVGPETMAALNASEVAPSEAPTTPNADEVNTSELSEAQASSPNSSQRGLEGLPPRSEQALGGQDFMNSIEHLRPGQERNQAVLNEILSGNIPENSRSLQNVTVQRNGREISMDVMPDYLAIGSNEDNVRVPMTPEVAQAIADRTGMSLPTDRIVDDIHAQARQLHLDPFAWREGQQHARNMESIGYYRTHDDRIDRQLGSGTASTELVSGHKKDLVIPARDGRVAIYGGRWSDGSRVQSYSNVHGESYEDYSHGARLISQQVTIDGQTMNLAEALADPNLRTLFTSQSGNFRYD